MPASSRSNFAELAGAITAMVDPAGTGAGFSIGTITSKPLPVQSVRQAR